MLSQGVAKKLETSFGLPVRAAGSLLCGSFQGHGLDLHHRDGAWACWGPSEPLAQSHLNSNVCILGQAFKMPMRLVQMVHKWCRLKHRSVEVVSLESQTDPASPCALKTSILAKLNFLLKKKLLGIHLGCLIKIESWEQSVAVPGNICA